MEPGPLAANDPESLKIQQRNAFYESLPPAAKESFLRSLERAQERGLAGDAAWEAAVVAAETTYTEHPGRVATADEAPETTYRESL